MFLSKLTLNVRHHAVRRDFRLPYEMHKTILSRGFDGIDKEAIGRVLFRVDTSEFGPPILLVQSQRESNWSKLDEGYTCRAVEQKAYDSSFETGQRLRFRLRANPTWRKSHDDKLKNRLPYFSEEDQLRWLIRKGQLAGFKLLGQWLDSTDPLSGEPKPIPNFSVDVIPDGRSFVLKEEKGWHLAVRFEGVLEVTDPIQLRQAIAQGIGSAKGYGFGLLSVAPA